MHHEVGIAQSILDGVLQEAQQRRVQRILGVHVNIGALKAVSAEALQFHFQCLAEGTAAEGAALHITAIPPSARCSACMHEFDPDHMLATCPQCDSPRIEVTAGLELFVDAIDVA